jgi:hypothetical protein
MPAKAKSEIGGDENDAAFESSQRIHAIRLDELFATCQISFSREARGKDTRS